MEKIFLETYASYKTIFERSLDPILLMDRDHFILCNQATLEYLELDSKEEITNIHPSEISPEKQPCGRASSELANEYLEEIYKTGEKKFNWLHKNKKGKSFWVEVAIIKIDIAGKEHLHVTWHDISKLKEAEEDLKKINLNLNSAIEDRNRDLLSSVKLLEEYKKAIDQASIVSKTDTKGIITYVNQAFIDISGYSKEELIGKPHKIIRHPDTPKKVFKDLWDTILNKEIWTGVVRNRKKNGDSYYVQSTICPILDAEGEIKEFIAIRVDISEIYNKEKIINRQRTDTLTSLPNRLQLIEDLKIIKNKKLALINIDRFRDLNDTYGHELGDKLLKKFAKRLQAGAIEETKIYRLYGDEFGILGSDKIEEEEFINFCKKTIKSYRTESFQYKDYEFDLPIRVGITFDKTDTLVQAEIAITQARKDNSGLFVIGEDSRYKEELANNILWTKKIRDAIKESRFVAYTQGIHPLKAGLPKKCESLVRMVDEDGKIVSPFFFLDIAKKSRLYPEISKQVINESFEKLSDFDGRFSINITIDDILNQNTVNLILNKLKMCKTRNVVFEIVESEGIENFSEVIDFIKTVKELGCEIAIDDFGTGYSNFEYIVKLDVDMIKVDGSLIKNIHQEPHLRSTVEAIVTFAKGIGLETVAEFVHNQEVLDIVKELGFDYAQGFHLDEPKKISNTA